MAPVSRVRRTELVGKDDRVGYLVHLKGAEDGVSVKECVLFDGAVRLFLVGEDVLEGGVRVSRVTRREQCGCHLVLIAGPARVVDVGTCAVRADAGAPRVCRRGPETPRA